MTSKSVKFCVFIGYVPTINCVRSTVWNLEITKYIDGLKI